jgi:hypothetical protein
MFTNVSEICTTSIIRAMSAISPDGEGWTMSAMNPDDGGSTDL